MISLQGFPAYLAIVAMVIIVLALPLLLISKFRRKAFDINRKFDNLVVTAYEAPLNLTPAEVGYLADAKFTKRELYATLLDLEQREFLEIQKESLGNYQIKNLDKSSNELCKHEKFVLKSFSNTTSASFSNQINLKKFKNFVCESMVDKELIKRSHIGVNYLIGRIILLTIILNTLFTLLFLFGGEGSGSKIIFIILSPLLFTPITLPVSIILGYAYNKIVGDMGQWTKKMKSAWADVQGFNEYIKQVELDNIQFESESLKSESKISALPYAVALGLDSKWEERF